MTSRALARPTALLALLGAFVAPVLAAAAASPEQLVQRLQHGGYVLVMRHAEAPAAEPSSSAAEPDNPQHERQLNAAGKHSAELLGAALRRLHIPVGPVYTSPLYRARETLRVAGITNAQSVPQLAEGARGMASTAAQAQDRWLRRAVRTAPPPGSNTLIVTHTPNLVGAFGKDVADVQAAEILVFDPHVPAHPVGRLRVAQWQGLTH